MFAVYFTDADSLGGEGEATLVGHVNGDIVDVADYVNEIAKSNGYEYEYVFCMMENEDSLVFLLRTSPYAYVAYRILN